VPSDDSSLLRDIALHRIERDGRGHSVYVRLPDYDSERPDRSMSAGTFNGSEAHGLLVRTGNAEDLRAVAAVLIDAADGIEGESDV
jgi:hypothetical protein